MTTTTTCPAWCDQHDDGDDFISSSHGTTVYETVDQEGGPYAVHVTRYDTNPAHIQLCDGKVLSAAQARQMADALNRAAELADY